MVDENIEVMDTAHREDAKDKDEKRARVNFPIVKLPQLSFFVVAVSISVGGNVVVETSSDFTMTDYNTFLAWRSDRSDW